MYDTLVCVFNTFGSEDERDQPPVSWDWNDQLDYRMTMELGSLLGRAAFVILEWLPMSNSVGTVD